MHGPMYIIYIQIFEDILVPTKTLSLRNYKYPNYPQLLVDFVWFRTKCFEVTLSAGVSKTLPQKSEDRLK